LALCLVATLPGCTTVAAIAQFGRLRTRRLGHALGFRDGKMPCANTLTNLLVALAPDHLDRVIGAWLADRHAAGWQHLSRRQGPPRQPRRRRAGAAPPYAPQAAAVAQMRREATTNEHKAALRLLGVLPLAGAVLTADATFTHVDVCAAVLRGGGDYLLDAKDNQPRLRGDIEAAFAAVEAGAFSPAVMSQWLGDAAAATSRCQGHGRVEWRTLTTSTWLNGYLGDWTGVALKLARDRPGVRHGPRPWGRFL
jgi:hypothetical protein